MGRKGPEGQYAIPTVCLADQEATACIIHMGTHLSPRTLAHILHAAKQEVHTKNPKLNKCMPTTEASVKNTQEERGRDVVKDREVRRNWPNAKIIQARSEINPRAWKLWINLLLSCSQETQNKMCKRAGTHEACILRASCVNNAE